MDNKNDPSGVNGKIVSSASGMEASRRAKKPCDKRVIAIVVLVILAIGGVGFGVFGMVTKSQANQRADALDVELGQKNEALKQAEEKLGAEVQIEPEEKNEEDGKAPIANVQVSAARDYIYIGEWGIKIKIPENLHTVSYTFLGGRENDMLSVSGVICDKGQCHYVPDFLEEAERGSGLGILGRDRKSDYASIEEDGVKTVVEKDGSWISNNVVVFEDDEYYYVYEHPHGVTSINESEKQWEVDSVEAIGEMFKTGISAF